MLPVIAAGHACGGHPALSARSDAAAAQGRPGGRDGGGWSAQLAGAAGARRAAGHAPCCCWWRSARSSCTSTPSSSCAEKARLEPPGRRAGRRGAVVRSGQPGRGVEAVRGHRRAPRRCGGAHGARGLRLALVARGAHLGRQGGFSDLIAPLQPVLAQTSWPPRRAPRRPRRTSAGPTSCSGRDGIAADPAALYRNALADDAGNVYAHTMWAHLAGLAGRQARRRVRQHLGGRRRARASILAAAAHAVRHRRCAANSTATHWRCSTRCAGRRAARCVTA